jgi:two-component system sensor histidine kinase RegB
MAFGQVTTAVVVDRVLHIDLPLGWICIPPLLVVLSNVWLSLRTTAADRPVRFAESTLIGWMFVLDTLCLTAVLMLTGGPNNPFSLLYLVHITLSAMILNQRQTWALGALACLCFALLFRIYRPIAALEMHHQGESVNLHLTGMWVGFAVASLLVTMFSGKISELLREREKSLLDMQEELARKDRLASLVALAAGAAHELSTPLGTIAVVAKEMEHHATRTVPDGAMAEDSRLIRTEVDRCRQILHRMSVEGAEPGGEPLDAVPVEDLLNGVVTAFSPNIMLRIEASREDQAAVLTVPRHAVEQAITALVKNGIEASPADSPVSLSVSRSPGSVRFVVKDCGSGMSPDSLRHAGEPFFTTKDPGKGMGLGIFLVRTVADSLGGRLTLESLPGTGTSAVLELPLAAASERVPA